MLYRLEIENFFSIRETQVIDLIANDNAPDEPERLAPIWPGAAERAPKVIALFGANASGKSTVLRALSFIAWFVRNSFQLTPETLIPYLAFLDGESQNRPTRLAVTFSGPAELDHLEKSNVPECRYEYEVAFSLQGAKPQEVISETLKYWPLGRQVHLFKRDKTGAVKANKAFALSGYLTPLKNVLRKNVSVISTLAQLKHPVATYLWNTANSVVSNILFQKEEFSDDGITQFYDKNPECLDALNQYIERIDFGLRTVELQKLPTGTTTTVFHHNGISEPLHLRFESHGTRQFIKAFPLIFQALKVGGVAVIDELDLSFHPLVLPEILRWFYDAERNPKNAQLWMTCQSASLLEDLIKEEVIFCEKDSKGRTTVYGLSDIQAVRRSDNYFQKYLSGVYGAVPKLG